MFDIQIVCAEVVAYMFGKQIVSAAVVAYIFGIRIVYAAIVAYIFGFRIMFPTKGLLYFSLVSLHLQFFQNIKKCLWEDSI